MTQQSVGRTSSLHNHVYQYLPKDQSNYTLISSEGKYNFHTNSLATSSLEQEHGKTTFHKPNLTYPDVSPNPKHSTRADLERLDYPSTHTFGNKIIAGFDGKRTGTEQA